MSPRVFWFFTLRKFANPVRLLGQLLLNLYAAHNYKTALIYWSEVWRAHEANARSRQQLAITMLVLDVLLGWVIIMMLQLLLNSLQG